MKIVLTAFGLLLSSSVWAQDKAVVVTTCGTPPGTYANGEIRPILQDTTGTICTTAGSGGGAGDASAANQATEIISLGIMDDWDESDRAKVNPIVGVAGVAAGAGAVGTTTQRTTLASDDPAVTSLATIDNTQGTKAAGVAASQSNLGGAVYNSSGVTLTDGQQAALQFDAFGLLKTGQDGLAVSGTATSAATLFTQDMLGYESITVQVTSAGSATITYETSDDNSTWNSTTGVVSTNTGAGAGAFTSTTAVMTQFPRRGRYFRARVSSYSSGTVTVVGTLSKAPFIIGPTWNGGAGSTVTVAGSAAHDAVIASNPVRIGARGLSASYATVATGDTTDLITTLDGRLITNPLAIPENTWTYPAATGGISNTTTAVTIKTADAALRNYVDNCQISSDPLGAATELAIRDGAGGTVLWRMKIGTAGIVNGLQIQFMPALRGTAATLTEIVTLSASVTGGVFMNCQGHVAP